VIQEVKPIDMAWPNTRSEPFEHLRDLKESLSPNFKLLPLPRSLHRKQRQKSCNFRSAYDPSRSLNFTNFRRPVLPLLRTFALHGGDACFTGNIAATSDESLYAPALGDAGRTLGENEVQPQPVPDYQFDQRIAW